MIHAAVRPRARLRSVARHPVLQCLTVVAALACPMVAAQQRGPSPPVLEDALVPGTTGPYVAAVRHFNPRLDDEEAYLAATFVIESGHRQGLDTRFALAAMVEDGLLARIEARPEGLRIGTRAAAGVLDALACDLGDRVERLARGGKASDATLRKALFERATQKLFRGPGSELKAADYVDRVMKRYAQLRGEK